MATIDYEPCIVSFIDILGFRNLIETRNAAEIFEAISNLQKFAKPPAEDNAQSPLEPRFTSQAFAHAISDAIVRVRPYNTDFRDGAFFWELLDLLHAQVDLLNHGILIRAGVTVGNVFVGPQGEGPIFGPAMVRAYEIESEEAAFPRIVVDDHALDQHRADPRLRARHNTLDYEIEQMNRLLATGEDGTRYIDYLRASASEFDSFGDYLDFLDRHAALIRDNLKKKMTGNVRRKFEWLAHYHNRVASEHLDRFRKSKDASAAFEDEFEIEAIPYFEALFVQ